MNKKPFFLVIVAYFLVLLCNGCTTLRLERRLKPDIKEWYDLHSLLMENEVPEWICKDSEKGMFLHFPSELQRGYIKIFWKIRRPEAREIFESRLEYVNECIKEPPYTPWKTDRGRLFLLCGTPTYITYFYGGQWQYLSPEGYYGSDCYMTWIYIRPAYARFTFEKRTDDSWRLVTGDLVSNQNEIQRWWREFFAPTEDGWWEVASWLISNGK